MEPEVLIGLLGILVLVVLMFLRVWIGVVMIIVGFVGYVLLGGWDNALTMMGQLPYTRTAHYPLTAAPMFVLMGTVVAVTGISRDLYDAAVRWLGRIRGGLAMSTILACGGFAAMCGDSIASAVTMGKVAYPQMKRYNYDDRLSSASIVAGGTIGVLIPPSVIFILYGIITETSVGSLFMAGIIPGILEVIFYLTAVYIVCRFNPAMGPPGPSVPLKEKIVGLKTVWPMVLVFVMVIGGIYGGYVTPTEAGALGAFAVILIGFLLRRLSFRNLIDSAVETGGNVCMILLILIGAFVFMRFITLTGIPRVLSDAVVALDLPHIAVLFLIILLYIFLGCFLNSVATMILTVPIILPTVIEMGYHPIWWGVINVRIIEVAMITPPIGINIFVLARTINLPITTLYRGILPFFIADVAHISLLLTIPELSMYLPQAMLG